jgi:D-alanine transaminase
MGRQVYVNGGWFDEREAVVSVFDRGFLMADGVYEVTAVLEGRLLDYPAHVARLHRSLSELEMAAPCSDDDLLALHREIVARNALAEGMIYLQVTRGNPGDRSFVWETAAPTLVMFTQAKDLDEAREAETGIRVLTVPDIRWGRRDIKTVQLLAPSWCKMMARKAGKDDAWMVTPEGMVNEGTSNNAWIVTAEGTLVTRQLSNDILHGITRAAVIAYAREAQVKVEERPFSVAEARGAAEAFITAASTFVCPVVEIDGVALGGGRPGPVARRLREIYLAESRRTAI